jgi:rhamnulose-1-phosphate aldolase
MEAFDMVDTLSKSAQIYLSAKAMGFTPEGTARADMEALQKAFGLK